MLGCGNGKNMIYNSLRHPPRRLSSFQLSGRLNETIKKNTGKNTRLRYWQHPRPFGTTVDNRRTSRGNSGFSELLPVASVFGVCGIGLKIYFENKRVAKHNDEKIIVEEETDVLCSKENSEIHVDAKCKILLDSGAMASIIPQLSLRYPSGKKIKVVKVDATMQGATTKTSHEYKTDIGIIKKALLSEHTENVLISIGSLLNYCNKSGVIFSIDGAWAVNLDDLERESFISTLIARRDNTVLKWKCKSRQNNVWRVTNNNFAHDLWYCEQEPLQLSDESIIDTLNPVMIDTGASKHFFSKKNFKTGTTFTTIYGGEVANTTHKSNPLLTTKLIPKLGCLNNIRVIEKDGTAIVSPHCLLKDVDQTLDGAFLFTPTCVYLIHMNDIKNVKKHKIGYSNNGVWFAYPEYFGLSTPGSNKNMSDIWAKSEYKRINPKEIKDNQKQRTDGIVAIDGSIIVSDGIEKYLLPTHMLKDAAEPSISKFLSSKMKEVNEAIDSKNLKFEYTIMLQILHHLNIKDVFKEFATAANDGKLLDQSACKACFKNFMRLAEKDNNSVIAALELITIIDGIFNIFDPGRNGYVRVSELAIGLSLFCGGNPDDKAKAIFSLLDHEGDGAITLENLRVCMECLIKVIHAARGNGALPANVARAYAERMFIREGLNHDDHLSFNQFLKFIMPYLGKS